MENEEGVPRTGDGKGPEDTSQDPFVTQLGERIKELEARIQNEILEGGELQNVSDELSALRTAGDYDFSMARLNEALDAAGDDGEKRERIAAAVQILQEKRVVGLETPRPSPAPRPAPTPARTPAPRPAPAPGGPEPVPVAPPEPPIAPLAPPAAPPGPPVAPPHAPPAGPPAAPRPAPAPAPTPGPRPAPPGARTPETAPAPKSPEELAVERRKEEEGMLRKWIYELTDVSRLPGEKPKEGEEYKPSPNLENAVTDLFKKRAEWMDASVEVVRLKKDLAKLEKERDRLERTTRPDDDRFALALKEQEIIRVKNAIANLRDVKELEAELENTKEKLKVKIIDGFKEEKGRFIVKDYEKKHGKTIGDADLEARLEKEMVEEFGPRVMLESIYQLDETFDAARNEAVGKFEQKKWWTKLAERYQKLSLVKKLGASAAIAAGAGAATAAFLPVSAVALGAGTLGFLGYRALRGVAGAAAAGTLYKFVGKPLEKLQDKAFGWLGARRRRKMVSETGKKLADVAGDAKGWSKDEVKKLEFAKVLDAQAREYQKKMAALATAKKWTRRGVAVAVGVGAGYGTGALMDAIVSGNITNVMPKTITDVFTGSKKPDLSTIPATPCGPEFPYAVGGGVAPEMFYEPTPEVEDVLGKPAFVYPEGAPSSGEPGGTTPALGTEEFQPSVSPGGAEAAGGTMPSGLETIRPGGRYVWGAIEHQLDAQGKFAGLNNAQQTYAIDYIKDEIGKNPQKWFGIENIDKVRTGQTLDFTRFWQENPALADHAVSHARELTGAQMDTIVANDAKLHEWVHTHKGHALTPDRIQEILGLKKITVPEMAAPSTGAGEAGLFPSGEPPYAEPHALPQPEIADLYSVGIQGETPTAEVGGEIPEEGGVYELVMGQGKPEVPAAPWAPSGGEFPPPTPGGGVPPAQIPAVEGAAGVSPAPETTAQAPTEALSPIETAFGSRAEYAIANKLVNFSLGEYGALKGVTVERLLSEIPSRDEAWAIFRGDIPGKTVDLPHYDWFYDSIEFGKQIKLAEHIRVYTDALPAHSPTLKMTISQFLQQCRT